MDATQTESDITVSFGQRVKLWQLATNRGHESTVFRRNFRNDIISVIFKIYTLKSPINDLPNFYIFWHWKIKNLYMNLHTAMKKKKINKSLASDWPEFHLYRVLFPQYFSPSRPLRRAAWISSLASFFSTLTETYTSTYHELTELDNIMYSLFSPPPLPFFFFIFLTWTKIKIFFFLNS